VRAQVSSAHIAAGLLSSHPLAGWPELTLFLSFKIRF